MSAGALLWMARWTPAVDLAEVALVLAIFGAGFGLTVTPRSTAAVETAGRASFGMASAIVTVARMIGMAIGVAVLTAYGSTTINHLYDELFAVPDGWKQVIPEELRDRPLRDAFVVDALEAWASGKASEILVGLFVVAGVVTIVAVPPGLALGGAARTRMLADDRGEDAGLARRRRRSHGSPMDATSEAPPSPSEGRAAGRCRPDRLLVTGGRHRVRRRGGAGSDARGPGGPRLGRPRRSVAGGRPVGRPRPSSSIR